MSISNLTFTKDWTNPADFPTVETSEVQVRQDLQLLHDETKEKLNEIIPVINTLSSEGIYVAVKDTTTIAELLAAYNAGLTIVLKETTLVNTVHFYLMSWYAPGSNNTHVFYFGAVYNGNIRYLKAQGAAAGTTTWYDATVISIPDEYAPLDSPELYGTPTAPSASAYDNSTQIATTEHVKDVIGRTTPVTSSDTNYTTLMVRGESLHDSDTTPSVNGAICWTYE